MGLSLHFQVYLAMLVLLALATTPPYFLIVFVVVFGPLSFRGYCSDSCEPSAVFFYSLTSLECFENLMRVLLYFGHVTD